MISTNKIKDMDIIGGWAGDQLNNFTDNFKAGLNEIGHWIVTGFFEITTPFFNWGCKSIIVMCVIIYYCSQDKKAISRGLWTMFAFILFFMLRSVVIK